MATPAAILSVLVEANTTEATAKLTKYERDLEKANVVAKKGIQTRLGGSYDPKAFAEYQRATKRAMERTANRAAFKAELGANFSPVGFRAYQRALDRTERETERAKVTSGGFGTAISGVGSKLMGIAAFATGASLGIGAIAKSSLEAQVGFQKSMEVIRTQAHQTQGEVDSMSKAVEELAPAVGTSADELAKGLYHIESQGLHSAAAMKALRVAAEGAKIGNANLEDVTNALGATLASGAEGTQNMRAAMGQLNAVVGAGDMRMQDLADALGTGLLGPMKQFGVSLRDIGGALAVFGDNNIRGADAATKLSSAIRIMAAPSGQAAKELKTIGISSTQLADDIRQHGLVAAFEDLKQHLDDAGLSASQQALVLSRAFGGRQATGVQLLIGQLERLKTKTKEVGEGAGKFGGDWTATTKTLAFQLDKTRATFESLEIAIGKMLAPLVPLLNAAAGAVARFVTQMQEGKGAGGQFARAVSTAFNIAKRVVVAVAPIVVAEFRTIAHVIRQVFPTAKRIVIDAFHAIKDAFRTARNVARAVFPVIRSIVLWTFNAAKWAWNNILKPAFDAIKTAIGVLLAVFQVGFALMKIPIQIAFNFAKTMWDNVLHPVFNAIKWTIENVVIPAFDAIKGPVSDMAGTVVSMFNWMKGAIGTAVDFILGALSTFLDGLGAVTNIASKIPGIGDLFDGVNSKVQGAADAVNRLRDSLRGVFGGGGSSAPSASETGTHPAGGPAGVGMSHSGGGTETGTHPTHTGFGGVTTGGAGPTETARRHAATAGKAAQQAQKHAAKAGSAAGAAGAAAGAAGAAAGAAGAAAGSAGTSHATRTAAHHTRRAHASQSATDSSSFDLAPTGASITMPTLVDVRRAIRRGGPAVVHHHHGNINVRVEKAGDELKVMHAIEKMTGTKIHAKMRAAGMRGT